MLAKKTARIDHSDVRTLPHGQGQSSADGGKSGTSVINLPESVTDWHHERLSTP